MDLTPEEFLDPRGSLGIVPKVIALTIWPDDEHKRMTFILSCVREAGKTVAHKHKTGLELTREFLSFREQYNIPEVSSRDLLRTALPIVAKGSSKAPDAPEIIGGQIAGQILIEAIELSFRGQEDISLNQCLELLSNKLAAQPTPSARVTRARPKDLKPHWHQYRSVAHLWAAWMIGSQIESLDIRFVLMLSQKLLFDGACIKHRNAKESFFPFEKAWRVPENVVDVITAT